MSVSELPRPGESPASEGPHHRTKTFEDGCLDDADVIVGRNHERRLPRGLVESLNVGGVAVVIHGEPGMARTSLLQVVADYASRQGVSAHMLRGIESEAALHFTLRPVNASLPRYASELALPQGIDTPIVFPIARDLTQALARAGESNRSRQILNWLEERAQIIGLAYLRAAVCRAKGILGPHLFAESLAALMLFESLGARPWAARTRAELAASGVEDQRVTQLRAGSSGLEQLRPQERQVAGIAGRGQNNVEVVADIFRSGFGDAATALTSSITFTIFLSSRFNGWFL